MPLADETDSALLHQWRAGAADAGQVLVNRHYPCIRRIFCINGPSNDWVADMVQQTFLIFVERRDLIEDSTKVKSYLLGIANNLLREYFKAKRRRGPIGGVELDDATLLDVDAPGFTTLFSSREERLILMRALRCVPIQDQLMLQYKYWDGLTNREIAGIVGVPVGTLAGRLGAARRRLAAQVRRLNNFGELLGADWSLAGTSMAVG